MRVESTDVRSTALTATDGPRASHTASRTVADSDEQTHTSDGAVVGEGPG